MNGIQDCQRSESALNVNQPIGTEKRCSKCREIKTLEHFCSHKRMRDGLASCCRVCKREADRLWIKANYEKRRKSNKEWYLKNIDRVKKTSKEYAKKHPEVNREACKKYRQNNKETRRESVKKYSIKIRSTAKGGLNYRLSQKIRRSLKGNKKGRHWETLVGYTVEQLKQHIEGQFKEGMTWENWGVNGWHIDHKIPKSKFNFEKPEDDDFKRCWALENLQPVWAEENLIKKDKLKEHLQPKLIFSGAKIVANG